MSRLVDDPAELRRLHERTDADAVDMESGLLAATGRLRGCVRAISDTPAEPSARWRRRSRPTAGRACSAS
jgi:nucleoside phosphorylase